MTALVAAEAQGGRVLVGISDRGQMIGVTLGKETLNEWLGQIKSATSPAYLAVMPTNLYGPGDNYHPENSHVIPALIRKFHAAKQSNAPTVTVWGSGTPRREFLYSDDMADACVFLMNLPDEKYQTLLGSDEAKTGIFMPPVVNIGTGMDVTIKELAETIRNVVGYPGEILFDPTQPDGTPRKLLDVGRLNGLGWFPMTGMANGLSQACDAYSGKRD